jgi:hypothetical protein
MAAGGIGAQLSQPPVALINTANAFTNKYFQPVLADSVFKPSPTWWRVTRMGMELKGGGAIVWPVVTSEETTGGAYYGAQLLDTSAQDSAQPAELQWKFYYQSIVIPYTDVLLNSGPGEVIPLVRAKEEIAMGSLLQKLSRALYAVSPNNTSDDLDSLLSGLSGSGTYAGITIGGQWECNGGSGPASGSALSLANMQSDYGSCTYGNEEPDTIITTQAGWNAFWALMQPNQRFVNDEETTRAGFKNHLMFNNAVVLHDQFVPSGDMIFLTTKYASPVFNPADFFTVEPFIRPSNQRVIVSQIFVMMNMRLLTLRQHGIRTSITNA